MFFSSLALIFIFGTIVGSFLNVVILRYNTGRSITKAGERSECFSCGKKLEWFELVPVLSFIFLGGKCSGCKSRISWQYPLVEIATGLIFAGIFVQNFKAVLSTEMAALLTFLEFVIWSLLVVITVYDLRHKIIPDGMVYAFAVVAFIRALIFPFAAGGSFAYAFFAGISFFALFGLLWLVSQGRWLGFGDAKLVFGAGLLLGFASGLSALTLAFWIGAAISVALMAVTQILQNYGKRAVRGSRLRGRSAIFTMKSEIPFAPFIVLGMLISFFCSIDIFGLTVFL